MALILQSLNYLNLKRASEEETKLLVDAWNSLKTRTYYTPKESKEGITY